MSGLFDGIAQLDLEYDGHRGRLPLFFRDMAMTTAVFAARASALRRLLPDARFVPARLAPGVGLVAVAGVEYRDSDVGAYREVLVAIPIQERPGPQLPARSLLAGVLRGRHTGFVLRMPVTTEIALATGRRFWNFPKFVADIEVRERPQGRSFALAEQDEPILTLEAPRPRTPRSERLGLLARTWMDGQPQSCEFRVLGHEVGYDLRPGAASIALGERHPMALELAGALLSGRALGVQVAPRCEGILFGPDRISLPLVAHAARAAGELSLPPLPVSAPAREPVGG